MESLKFRAINSKDLRIPENATSIAICFQLSHRTARVDRIRGSFHECIDFKLHTCRLRNLVSTLGQSFREMVPHFLLEDVVDGLRDMTFTT